MPQPKYYIDIDKIKEISEEERNKLKSITEKFVLELMTIT